MGSIVDGFASIVLRLSIESDAMNMVEHLGAFTPHRSAPIAIKVKVGDGLKVVRAPAASGQMMAHAYQVALAMIADKAGLPLCDDCRNHQVLGGFVKRSLEDPKKFANKEFEVISTCVVEDLAGFMIVGRSREGGGEEGGEGGEQGKKPRKKGKSKEDSERIEGLRRTAPVWFSYMLPDPKPSSFKFEPQFHVMFNTKGENRPFTIESATAIYTMAIGIDVRSIGRAPNKDGAVSEVADRDKRVELALEAFRVVIHGQIFGAKKSRYLPRFEVIGGAASLSNPIPFMLSPPKHVPGEESYVSRSYNRALKMVRGLGRIGVAQNIYIAYFDTEGIVGGLEGIVKREGGQREKAQNMQKRFCTEDKEGKVGGSVCIEEVGSFDDLINWLRDKIFKGSAERAK
jgi:CRISPR-associated protein Csa2